MADDPKDPPAKGDPDELGEKGKKALEDERRARREAEKQLKEFRDELQQLKDRDKGDVEKLTEKAATAEKRAEAAEAKLLRFEVAADKGVKAKYLTGSTREELEAAAEEYLKDHPPADGGGGDPPPKKPAEDLKGGGDPTSEPTTTDPVELAKSVPRL